ncbi:hypothetical protein NPIL_148701 [Nephila pilipes]|uniref:Uncharacterized protein n=1 Tax=Nephila pilipes TaxID=299642 RepID=A0A8X6UA55_NEPPI|nr:hypothetical protein NPIL_148701 [Nephila pilipes]
MYTFLQTFLLSEQDFFQIIPRYRPLTELGINVHPSLVDCNSHRNCASKQEGHWHRTHSFEPRSNDGDRHPPLLTASSGEHDVGEVY